MTGNPSVVVIGATSVPWFVDPVVVHKFSCRIHVGLPDQSERVEILKKKLGPDGIDFDEQQFHALATKCDGFVADDIERAVVNDWRAQLQVSISSTRFRKIMLRDKEWYCACSPDDEGAERIGYSEIQSRFYPGPTTYMRMEKAIEDGRQLVNMTRFDADKHVRWSEKAFWGS